MFFDKPKQEYKQNKTPFYKNISAFWKNETAFGFLKRRFDFLRIFVLIGRVGSCGFESKAMVCRLWLWHKEKNNRQDCPADCFSLCCVV